MTSIPARICRTYRKDLKRHYLRSKRVFLDLLLHFWNVPQISSIFRKDESPARIISEIVDSERRGYLNV